MLQDIYFLKEFLEDLFEELDLELNVFGDVLGTLKVDLEFKEGSLC